MRSTCVTVKQASQPVSVRRVLLIASVGPPQAPHPSVEGRGGWTRACMARKSRPRSLSISRLDAGTRRKEACRHAPEQKRLPRRRCRNGRRHRAQWTVRCRRRRRRFLRASRAQSGVQYFRPAVTAAEQMWQRRRTPVVNLGLRADIAISRCTPSPTPSCRLTEAEQSVQSGPNLQPLPHACFSGGPYATPIRAESRLRSATVQRRTAPFTYTAARNPTFGF